MKKEKTHCVHGHVWNEENVASHPVNGSRCRVCHREKRLEEYYIKKYGLSCKQDRERLLLEQGSACAICGREGLEWGDGFNDVWHIDHDHDRPGTHRGILCAACNLALGKLEKHMDKVIAYLEKYKHQGGTEGPTGTT